MKVLLQELNSTKSTLTVTMSSLNFISIRSELSTWLKKGVPRGFWRTTYGVLPMDTKACGGLG